MRSSPRHITLIVLHVSDTRPSQNYTVEQLARDHKARGFGDYPGYHFYIKRDGTLYYTRPIQIKGCHVAGHNANSIGICCEGGHREPQVTISSSAGGPPPMRGSEERVPFEDNRTLAQKETLDSLLRALHAMFPSATLCGHRDLNPAKACPCMDARREYAYIFDEAPA